MTPSYIIFWPCGVAALSVARQGDQGRAILESPPDARASGIGVARGEMKMM